jgi:hypothetical protein
MLQQLIAMYEVISHRQLNDLKKEAKNMSDDPQTPFDVVINHAEDLIEFGDMTNCLYSSGQMTNIASIAIHNPNLLFKIMNLVPYTLHPK